MDIDYAQGLNLDVDVEIGTLEGVTGRLEIASNMFPKLTIENKYSHYDSSIVPFFKSPPSTIICKSNYQILTLCQNASSGRSFLPDYVVVGTKVNEVTGVDVSLVGLFSFFNGNSSFVFKDSYLGKRIFDNFIGSEFLISDDVYNFSVNHEFSSINDFDKTIISEDAVVRIIKKNGFISLDEAKNIIKKVRVLFSLLLGFDLSIRKTWLVYGDDNYAMPFYFHAFSNSEHPFEHAHQCFMVSPYIFNNDMWSTILNKAFNGEAGDDVSNIWVRLVSLFSYKGFWEYRILGIVSLLDSYSVRFHKRTGIEKLPSSDFKALKRGMVSVLDSYRSSLLLQNDQKYIEKSQVVDSMISSLDFIRNTNAQTFQLTFNILFDSVDKDVQDLIGFADGDFKLIKQIRDLAAHGEAIPQEIIDNIQQAMIVSEKIKFLLLFIIYRTLGFSRDLFIECCGMSHHKIKLGAKLRKIKLDELTGQSKFFKLNDDDWVKVNSLKGLGLAVTYHVKSDYLEIQNDYLSRLSKDWWETKQEEYSSSVDLIYASYASDDYFGVEHVASLYLLNGDSHVELNGVIMLWLND